MIEEVFKAPGRWSLRLQDPSTEVLDALELRGHVIIMFGAPPPSYTGTLDRTELLQRSIYTGRVDQIRLSTGGVVEIAGPSIMAWLGDGSGKGPTGSTVSLGPTVTASAFLAALLTAARRNGLTFGAVETGYNFTSGAAAPAVAARDVTRQAMQREFDSCWPDDDLPWHVTPAGVINVGYVAGDGIGDVGPRVIVTRLGVDGQVSELNAPLIGLRATDLEVLLDGTDYATHYYARDTSGGYASASQPGTLPRDFDGVSAAAIHQVEPSGQGGAAEAASRAALQIRFHVDITEISALAVESRLDMPAILRPGDWLYVWDRDLRLVDESQREVILGSIPVHPVKVRCFGMRWPVTDGYGVVFASNDWSTVVDLTPFVAVESGPTSLTVGAPQRVRRNDMTRRW